MHCETSSTLRNAVLAVLITGLTLIVGVPAALAGSGTFQPNVAYPISQNPVSVAVGDFNGDGRLDVVTANGYTSKTVSVLEGNGDGTLQQHVEYATGATPLSVAVGDFNGDGKLDIVTSNLGGTLSVLLGNGDGTFQMHVEYSIGGSGSSASSIGVGDFNADGKLDLAATNQEAATVSVLLGDGDGTFQPHVDYVTGGTPESVAVGELNGDGKADLVTANDYPSDSVSVLLGNGDGTFRTHVDYPAGDSARSVVVKDFNRDGKADLAVVGGLSLSSSVRVLLGNGDGTFRKRANYLTSYLPVSVVVGDFNGDGKADVADASDGEDTVDVLLGNGDGSFQGYHYYGIGGLFLSSVAVGDLNGDGAVDLVTASESEVDVLLNSGGTRVMLRSSVNPATLGAPITFTASVRRTFRVGVPSGTVTFLDGGTVLATISLVSSEASLTISTLTEGDHTIKAFYSGDSIFNPSKRQLVQQVVP